MKIKIELKHRITGSILFEFECEGNTILKTLIEAVKAKADLQGADLRGADLQGADLRGAYLQGADLRGADLRGEKIQTAVVFTGLYTYIVIPYITEAGIKRIKMGCYDRSVDEWDKNFWNNDTEFPNNGSVKSNLRLMAFQTAKKWFDITKTKKTQPCS